MNQWVSSIQKISVITGLCALSVACTSLETFRKVEAESDPFRQALLGHYQAFAEKEAEKYDWLDSQHFIDKGMRVAYGQTILPEPVETWRVPKEHQEELTKARATLTEMLDSHAIRTAHPEAAAKAVFGFDCWVEEQEENWQWEDIAACKEMYYAAMKTIGSSPVPADMGGVKQKPSNTPLNTVPHTAFGGDKNSTAAKPSYTPGAAVETASKTGKMPFHYRLFFDFDSDTLAPSAKTALDHVAEDLKQLDGYEIVLNGYTDKKGNEDYNLQLSKERAVKVKKALLKRGVPANRIRIFAFGESDPSQFTADDVMEPMNRRVEVFIGD